MAKENEGYAATLLDLCIRQDLKEEVMLAAAV
jgi:hypothetical protein